MGAVTDFITLPHQVPPAGPWKTWILLGGRGAGKTRGAGEHIKTKLVDPNLNIGLFAPDRNLGRLLMQPTVQLPDRTLPVFVIGALEVWQGIKFDVSWLDEPLRPHAEIGNTARAIKERERYEEALAQLLFHCAREPGSQIIISQNDLGVWPGFFAQLLKHPTTVLTYPESRNPHLSR